MIYSKIAPYLNSAHLKIPKNVEKKFPKFFEKLVYDHLNNNDDDDDDDDNNNNNFATEYIGTYPSDSNFIFYC